MERCRRRCEPLLEQTVLFPRAFPEIIDKDKDYHRVFEQTAKLDDMHLLYMEPFISTRAKCEIMDFVLRMANNLAAGRFRQQVGPASKVLVGTKGVGKTNTLKRASILVASKHDDIIVVYNEYNNAIGIRTPLELLQQGIANRLGCWAHLVTSSFDQIQQLLVAHNLRILLILDELETIYRSRDTASQNQAFRAINDLATLGSNSSGRFATILCGSSVALPRLISGKRVDAYALSYTQMPNLNGSKFMSRHVSQPALGAREVTDIFQHCLQLDVSDDLQNVLCFFLSPNLRRLHDYKYDPEEYFRTILQDEFDTRATDTLTKHSSLIRRINSSLWEINKDMFSNIVQDGEIVLERVSAVKWADMKPMVMQMWESVEEMSSVQHLVDNGWFLATSDLRSIWPLTPATLLFCSHREAHPPQFLNVASDMLNRLKEKCTLENVTRAANAANAVASVGSKVVTAFWTVMGAIY